MFVLSIGRPYTIPIHADRFDPAADMRINNLEEQTAKCVVFDEWIEVNQALHVNLQVALF